MSNDEIFKLISNFRCLPDKTTTWYVTTNSTSAIKYIDTNQTIKEHIYQAINAHIEKNEDCKFYFSQLINIQFEMDYNITNILKYMHNMVRDFNDFYLRFYNTTFSPHYHFLFYAHKNLLLEYIKTIYNNFIEFDITHQVWIKITS